MSSTPTPKESAPIKILMIGDSGVGKSSILLRFTEDVFDDDLSCTIGVDCKSEKIRVGDEFLNLQIWDTAGQEKFRSLTSSYYRGTNAVILVYDVTQRLTFDHLDEWLRELLMYSSRDELVMLLVGNKIDCDEQRALTRDEGAGWARKHGMMFMETSAKTKVGVQQAFQEIAQKLAALNALAACVRSSAQSGGSGPAVAIAWAMPLSSRLVSSR